MSSQSTDSHNDPAPPEERADTTSSTPTPAEANAGAGEATEQSPAAQSSSSQTTTAATATAAPDSDAPKSGERQKIKIGSQREGSPRIRMERRLNADATVAPPAVQVPGAPKPPAPQAEATPEEVAPAESKTAESPPSKPVEAQAAPPTEAASEPVAVDSAPVEQPSTPVDQAAGQSPAGAPPAAEQPAAQPPAESAPSPPAAAEQAAAAIPVPKKKEPVRVPRKTDLDEEVEAALGGMSLDDVIAKEEKPQTGAEIEPETRRRGIVVRVHQEDVFFSLGVRNEGVAPLKNFPKPPEPGEQMDVIVSRFDADEGLYELHIPGAAADVSDWADISDGSVVEARITGSNTGGLECLVNNIRGFIPASQISMYRVENLGEYVGQKMLCVVTEVNPARKNLVLSHRAIMEREREEAKQSLLESLQVGEVREGTVRSLRDFGAFVDIGGIDGLIHISKLSWDHVKHPSEVLSEGQQVQVKVEKVDRQTGKIGLSYRDLLEDPWKDVETKYPSGAIVEGAVTRITRFGAFVKLEPGVEGLVHISELAHHRVANVSSYLSEGQTVQVKVVSVDPEAQRIGLSMKALVQAPAKASGKKQEEEADEAPRELAVPKRKGPLKGGRDKSSGGEKFGLNW